MVHLSSYFYIANRKGLCHIVLHGVNRNVRAKMYLGHDEDRIRARQGIWSDIVPALAIFALFLMFSFAVFVIK